MNAREPKDYRLFHYTRQLVHLEDMLENGFWPRYCEEDFEWLVDKPSKIAFPMVCFCDIPIDAANMHRTRYGAFAIAFNKAWASMKDINPVWYIQSESSIRNHIRDSLTTTPRFNVKNNLNNPFLKLLAFIKPTIAFQPDRVIESVGGRGPVTEVFAADEEMEWRYTPTALSDQWISHTSSGFVSE